MNGDAAFRDAITLTLNENWDNNEAWTEASEGDAVLAMPQMQAIKLYINETRQFNDGSWNHLLTPDVLAWALS